MKQRLKRKANREVDVLAKFFWTIYAVLSLKINLEFYYDDVWHLIVGTIVTTVILKIIDIIIFKLAFNLAGDIKRSFALDGSETKTAHWFFRALFVCMVYIFSLTPACKIIITPIVNCAYNYAEEKYRMAETNIISVVGQFGALDDCLFERNNNNFGIDLRKNPIL